MNNDELLERFNEFMKNVNTLTEIQGFIDDKIYLQNMDRNLTILKVTNKISEDNINDIMNELVSNFNKKYLINYKCDDDYHMVIDLMIDYLEKLINKKVQDKLKEKSVDKLLKEVFRNNE